MADMLRKMVATKAKRSPEENERKKQRKGTKPGRKVSERALRC
jgi:hypothetical protein